MYSYSEWDLFAELKDKTHDWDEIIIVKNRAVKMILWQMERYLKWIRL